MLLLHAHYECFCGSQFQARVQKMQACAQWQMEICSLLLF